MQTQVALEQYVHDLVQTLDQLRLMKEDLRDEIIEEEEEKEKIQQELEILSERLENVNGTIIRASAEKQDLEKTITDTQHTKNKIVESFKTLLQVLQKESFYHIKE